MAIMTRALGRTGADVTILSYGAMELSGQGPFPADRYEEERKRLPLPG